MTVSATVLGADKTGESNANLGEASSINEVDVGVNEVRFSGEQPRGGNVWLTHERFPRLPEDGLPSYILENEYFFPLHPENTLRGSHI